MALTAGYKAEGCTGQEMRFCQDGHLVLFERRQGAIETTAQDAGYSVQSGFGGKA